MALTATQSRWLIFAALAAGAYGVFSLRRAGGLGGSNVRFVGGRAREAPALESTTEGGMTVTHRAADDLSIESRVATIQKLIYGGVSSGPLRKLALNITSGCEARDKMCEAQQIFDYVQANVRYTGDIGAVKMPGGSVEQIDLFQSPQRTLEFGGGDCDDHSGACAALLALNGIDAYLKVTSETRNDDWSHIYCVANIDGKMIALDTTLPHGTLGQEAPAARALIFPA